MIQDCRFILLLEFTNDDELIDAIAAIEKSLPPYDYASRPLQNAEGAKPGGFKFLAFKELKIVTAFPKFFAKTIALQKKLNTVKISPGYVSLANCISASLQPSPGAIQVEHELYLKAQLVFSEKALMPYALTDAHFRDRRSLSYLNDVWQLVRGARK
ncbi:MAG: DUF4416 family protein [Turneriella sp.]